MSNKPSFSSPYLATTMVEWARLVRWWRLISCLFWFSIIFYLFLFITYKPISFLTNLPSFLHSLFTIPQSPSSSSSSSSSSLSSQMVDFEQPNPTTLLFEDKNTNSWVQMLFFSFTLVTCQMFAVYAHHILLSDKRRPLKDRKVLYFSASCLISCWTGVALVSQFFGFLTPSHSSSTLPIALYGAILALVLTSTTLLRREYILVFPQIQRLRYFRLKGKLPFILLRSLILSLISVILLVIYLSGRVNPLIFIQLFVSGFVLSFSWTLARALVHVHQSQHIAFDSPSSYSSSTSSSSGKLLGGPSGNLGTTIGGGKRNLFLFEGLNADKGILRSQAFLDLFQLSTFEPHRRRLLFEDDTYRSWSLVADTCISFVDALTAQELLLAPKKASPASSSKSLTQRVSALGSSLLDRLEESATAALSASSSSYGLNDPEKRSKLLLSSWVIQSLAKLTAASKFEDRIGVVQLSKGFQRTFTSLLALMQAIELQKGAGGSFQLGQFGHDLTVEELQTLRDVVRSSLYLLVDTFYESLQDYKDCPVQLLPTLQGFIDFNT